MTVSGAMRHEASLTGAETRASRDVAGGGGRVTVAGPDLRGTAPRLRRRTVRPCGGGAS